MSDDIISVSRKALRSQLAGAMRQPLHRTLSASLQQADEIIAELVLDVAATPQPKDSCGFCLGPIGERGVCSECWRKRTSMLEAPQPRRFTVDEGKIGKVVEFLRHVPQG